MGEPLTTPGQAVLRAHLLSGLSAVFGPPIATLTKVSNDVTPFLGERNAGKPAWHLEYATNSLRLPSARPGMADRYHRTFTVMLEAASGILFYIASTYEGKPDPDMRPMPSCGVATEQLSREEEVYDGYPDVDPKIDFLTALDSIVKGGVGSPYEAKEIHGVYVRHSYMGSKPSPAWAITLRGLPPLQPRGRAAQTVPLWQRNHMRNIVDAISGKVLFATNSPQPV